MEHANQGMHSAFSSRDFLGSALAGLWALAAAAPREAAVVSVVKITKDNIQAAVEKALDLLGGIESVAKGKGGSCSNPTWWLPRQA
jgi:hypothetical protein